MTTQQALRLLFVTSEAHPLIKTGGLGDVAGALPQALRDMGVDARLLLPAYPGLLDRTDARPLGNPLRVLSDMLEIQMYQGLMPDADTPVYLIDSPALYHRTGPYVDESGKDWPDNAIRFGELSRTAALFASNHGVFGWVPELVHCNDWQTGLTPVYMTHNPDNLSRTLISIHNMAFQGNFSPRILPHLDLPRSSYDVQGLEFHGQLSFLKAGLYYSDHITTVSPTYAKEICTTELGYGLEGLLSQRRLTGILNGVDTQEWDPETDRHLPANYSWRRLHGKAANKRALQERFALPVEPERPLLGIVSRLTRQKGTDLILGAADRLLREPVQLVALGSGDAELEDKLQRLQHTHPDRVGVQIGYDEPLAHLIEAGADIFLMPSRFEPCGLNQMYSMLYGTPPVVRETGGLADSVVDSTPRTLNDRSATGFVFSGDTEAELLGCIMRALILYQNRALWRKLQVNGMRRDFSWQRSAEQYIALYHALMQEQTAERDTPKEPGREP